MAIVITGDDWVAQLKQMVREVDPTGRGIRLSRLTMYNSVWYSKYLHERDGFFVFNDDAYAQIVYRTYRGFINRNHLLNERNARLAGIAAMTSYRTWLRTTTEEMRPPVKKSEGERSAYPGHWADVDAILQKGYWFTYSARSAGVYEEDGNPSATAAASQAKAQADAKKKTEKQ